MGCRDASYSCGPGRWTLSPGLHLSSLQLPHRLASVLWAGRGHPRRPLRRAPLGHTCPASRNNLVLVFLIKTLRRDSQNQAGQRAAMAFVPGQAMCRDTPEGISVGADSGDRRPGKQLQPQRDSQEAGLGMDMVSQARAPPRKPRSRAACSNPVPAPQLWGFMLGTGGPGSLGRATQ